MNAPAWFVDNIAAVPASGDTTHHGVAVRWYRWGPDQGPPLVLVHGAAANHAWWSPIAPLLAAARPVVAVELSGMGDAGWRDDGYTIEQWADEVTVAVAAACPRAGSEGGAWLVGHSLGASVVAAAAVRQPDQWAAVVLCDLGLAPSRSRVPVATAAPAEPAETAATTDEKGGTGATGGPTPVVTGGAGRAAPAAPAAPVARPARAERAGRVGRHFTNRILYPTEAEALAHFSLVPRQRCPNPWMIEHVAHHSIRPVGPGGVGDPSRPPAGEEIGWSWKFDWRLFARTSNRPLVDYLAELGRMAHNSTQGPRVMCLNGSSSRVATAAVAARITELAIPIRTVWLADAAHHLMLDQPLAFVGALRDLIAIPLGR